MKLTHAVIVAAGTGTRMAPFHLTRPKCLLPLLNEPLLLHLFRALRSVGVTHATVVGRPEDEPLVQSVQLNGLTTNFVGHAVLDGSAIAAAVGLDQVPAGQAALVIEADVVVHEADLRHVVESLQDHALALLVDALGSEAPQDWQTVDLSGDAVVGAWGHHREGEWRISGVYAMSPRAREALRRPARRGVRVPVGGMPHLEYDLAEVVNTLCESRASVVACRASHWVMNWDKPWHVYAGNLAALEAWAHGHDREVGEGSTIADTAQIRGPLKMGRQSRIGHGAIIEGPVVVGDRVVIDDYAKVSQAVVGHDVVISHTAEFLGGVIMDNVYLMHNCELYGVLGQSVDIGAGTVSGTLRFDDRGTPHRINGRWETPPVGSNASYIGDYSRTGVNVVILPGKHVGPYAAVGPGVVVNRDIEPYTEVLLEQNWTVRKWGPDRYGW